MKIIVVILCSFCFLAILLNVAQSNLQNNALSADAELSQVVILDAGHGGEDGGAVAPDGTLEKDLNLLITLNLADFFEVFGINYIPVRLTDISVCSPGLKSVRERKVSDIKNREQLVNSTDNAVFLSIHQNMFDIAKYNGTQVFYSANIPNSEVLAESIKNSVVTKLQPDNKRQCKPSGDSIYLLYNAKKTAVLVECGFLSNPDELLLLKDNNYQQRISYCIATGLLDYFCNKEDV